VPTKEAQQERVTLDPHVLQPNMMWPYLMNKNRRNVAPAAAPAPAKHRRARQEMEEEEVEMSWATVDVEETKVRHVASPLFSHKFGHFLLRVRLRKVRP
jgi:hypothetical protein